MLQVGKEVDELLWEYKLNSIHIKFECYLRVSTKQRMATKVGVFESLFEIVGSSVYPIWSMEVGRVGAVELKMLDEKCFHYLSMRQYRMCLRSRKDTTNLRIVQESTLPW